MNHSGTLSNRANMAARVQSSDQKTLLSPLAPRLRCRAENRLLLTNLTIEGVISQATSSTDSTTITGAAIITTISGASTERKEPSTSDSTHFSAASTSNQFSSVARTPETAASQ